MNLEYFEPDDLDRSTIDRLWDQGVNLDDWDYMLITYDVEAFTVVEVDEEVLGLAPISWSLGRLLTGCCSNIWYKITWRGEAAMVGVAYHS